MKSSQAIIYLSSSSRISFLFYGLVITCLTSATVNASYGGNETDYLALLSFKSKVTHDPYKVLTSWNHSFHFCYWSGVSCGKRHKRVTALRLVSHGLEGSLSPHVGNLSFLRELYLWNNSFQGTIPHELGHLSRLRRLHLGINKFSGVIPANLSGCSNLEELLLGLNKLVGSIPKEMSLLSKLSLLVIEDNKLTGGISPFFILNIGIRAQSLGKIETHFHRWSLYEKVLKRKREGYAHVQPNHTKECKAMLRNRIEQINLFNSNLSSSKFRNYTCFYCTQEGHVAKSCPTKLSDERLYAKAGATTFRHGDEATRARIRKNKETVKCFKCQGTGHFANACPQDDTKTTQKQEKEITAAIPSLPEPKVSVKYPEFIHFRTREYRIPEPIMDRGDDFWYISNTSNKHMTANLKFFLNLKEEFIVEKLEKQGKFLFTYGIGEVLIENGEGTYMIPGVHYAPKVTLNILSIGLLSNMVRDSIKRD
ncbi:ARID DNA-binding domain-containing protein [Tanacetum coccineum]